MVLSFGVERKWIWTGGLALDGAPLEAELNKASPEPDEEHELLPVLFDQQNIVVYKASWLVGRMKNTGMNECRMKHL